MPGQYPNHLTFSQEKHALTKQWFEKHLGLLCITGSTEYHYFAELLFGFFESCRRNFPPQARSPFVEKGTEFQRRVWDCIAEIPYGETKTCGEVA